MKKVKIEEYQKGDVKLAIFDIGQGHCEFVSDDSNYCHKEVYLSKTDGYEQFYWSKIELLSDKELFEMLYFDLQPKIERSSRILESCKFLNETETEELFELQGIYLMGIKEIKFEIKNRKLEVVHMNLGCIFDSYKSNIGYEEDETEGIGSSSPIDDFRVEFENVVDDILSNHKGELIEIEIEEIEDDMPF